MFSSLYILGWGFNGVENVTDFGPDAKMRHLESFIRQKIQSPLVVVGASLGGALAITLASSSTTRDLVEKVVLIDAQGFIDGKGPSDIPNFTAKIGVNILKSWPLRMYANLISYTNKKFSTWDAMLIGQLVSVFFFLSIF